MYKYDEMCIFEQYSYSKLLYEVDDFTERTRQNVVYAASVKTVLCCASFIHLAAVWLQTTILCAIFSQFCE